jgi:transcriptional regulator with XRE-family HTH domain
MVNKMKVQEKFQYVLIAEVGEGKRFSANALGNASGISNQTINNALKGKPSTLYVLQQVLDVLGYEITIQKKQTDETGN